MKHIWEMDDKQEKSMREERWEWKYEKGIVGGNVENKKCGKKCWEWNINEKRMLRMKNIEKNGENEKSQKRILTLIHLRSGCWERTNMWKESWEGADVLSNWQAVSIKFE